MLRRGVELAGKYILVEPLGEGTVGEVWQAFNKESFQSVALKVLKNQLDDPELADLRREAQILASLKHPGITIIHDFVKTDDDIYFIVMEYLKGRNLQQVLEGAPAGLPEIDVLSMAMQIAEALSTAHESKVIHRDLKPANLFREDSGGIKVCDFGIAVATADSGTTLSVSEYLTGTPAYMSPEQCDAVLMDARSDLYSLGCVLYELLTGQPPFLGPSEEVIKSHKEKLPKSPRQLRQDISADLDRLVMQLLAKNRQERPSDAKSLVLTLRQLQQRAVAGSPRRFVTALKLSDLLNDPHYLTPLGLLAVAKEGLRLGEIEHLSRQERLRSDQIQEAIERAESGIFACDGRPGEENTIYRMAGEIRRSEVARMLGAGMMRSFRDRLHEWADECRRGGWPESTPSCLLGSYARMLLETGDIGRLASCAKDAVRHDRLFKFNGGDADALAEIGAAQEALLRRDDPDLRLMAEIAVHRDELIERDAAIPLGLPAVWVMLGRADRANEFVRCIIDPDRRAAAIAEMTTVEAGFAAPAGTGAAAGYGPYGDHGTDLGLNPVRRAQILAARARDRLVAGQAESASELARQAEDAIRSAVGAGRDYEFAELAVSLARAGYRENSEQARSRIRGQPTQSKAQAGSSFAAEFGSGRGKYLSAERAADIAVACAETGYTAEANIAATIAISTYVARQYPNVLPRIASRLSRHFRRDTIQAIAACQHIARRYAHSNNAAIWKNDVRSAISCLFLAHAVTELPAWSSGDKRLARLALKNAANGYGLLADIFARRIERPELRSYVSADVALACAVRGRDVRALKVAAAISDPQLQSRSAIEIGVALAAADRFAVAMSKIAGRITDLQSKDQMLSQIALVCSIGGRYDYAAAAAASISDLEHRAVTLAAMITDVPETNSNHDRRPTADALVSVVREMAGPALGRGRLLSEPAHYAKVAAALTAVGRPEAAAHVAAEAQAFARGLPPGAGQAHALASAAATLFALPTSQSATNRRQARALVALALAKGPWHLSLKALSVIEPEILVYIATLLSSGRDGIWAVRGQ